MNAATEALSKGWALFFSLGRKKALLADFEQVALPQLNHLYRVALYFTKDKAEAEDLVQETYLKAFRSFHQFEPGTNCTAWLLTILRNLFFNRYRKKRQQQEEVVDWEKIDHVYRSIVDREQKAQRDNPESLFLSRLMDDEIEKALQELPKEFRTAVVLVDIEELSYEETAKVMECPIGTVRSRVSRGRRMLQVALRDYALERGIISE